MTWRDSLDALLVAHEAQPAAGGYIDVIVPRDRYRALADALYARGIAIEAVSWWEYLPDLEGRTRCGVGGPKNHYGAGWFAEISEFDDLPAGLPREEAMSALTALIEEKAFVCRGVVRRFRETPWLVPALWLSVDALVDE